MDIKHPFRYLAILAGLLIIAVTAAACGSSSSPSESKAVESAPAAPTAVAVAPSPADAPSVDSVDSKAMSAEEHAAMSPEEHAAMAAGESSAMSADEHAAMTKTDEKDHAAMSADEHAAMTKTDEKDHAAMSADEHAAMEKPDDDAHASMSKPDETVEESGADSETAVVADAEAEAEPLAEAAALLTAYDSYGFSLKLDLGAAVDSYGWTESDPSTTQGLITFNYGGVNTNLVWGPPEDRTPLTFLADTYNILRASQPDTTFESISDGDITVNDQVGAYGGFKATGIDGSTLGGGLIGTWLCPDADTAFRMTLTGEDATLVQLRFDRLLENFTCASSS